MTRVELPARTVLVAAGTAPNVTYEKEHPGSFALDGKARFFKGFAAVPAGAGGVHPRARSERLLHLVRPRRPLRQLLRRQPPALQRQRGQGHGLGQARLSQGGRALRRGAGGAGSGGAAGARPRLAGAGGAARRPAAGPGRAGDAADPDDHRGDRAGPGRGPALPSGPVLPPAELRARQCPRAHRRSRRGVADGGHRPHRRLGGSRGRPAVAHHAGDGRVEPAVRVPAAGRAGSGDGPDRDTDRDPVSRVGAAGRRRPRQRRAVLDRPGAEGAGQPGAVLRRLPGRRRSVQARGDRSGDRSGGVGHRFRGGDRAAAAAGPSLPRQHRPGDGRLRRRPPRRAGGAARHGRPADRHRLRSHDARGEGSAPRRAGAVPACRAMWRSAASTRRCSA